MCAFDPNDRPDVASVIAELKRFAMEEEEKGRVVQKEVAVLGEKRKMFLLDTSKASPVSTEIEVDAKALAVRVASSAVGVKRICRE